MSNRQFSNNASSILAGTITSTATSVSLSTGDGAKFPSLSGTQYFIITVQDTSGNQEYMKVTAISGDVLTVVRAQENSTASGFTANLARVELRDTAGTLAALYQKDGDTLTGPLNGGSQTATNLTIGSGCSVQSATEIVATPLRGVTGLTTNQIVVPADGSAATMGGLPILTGTSVATFTIGMIMAWNGSIPNIPTGWHICDGTNGTPNLQNQFIVGAGSTYSLGQNGNQSYSTSSVSAGTPAITPFTLTVAQLPSHKHPFDYSNANSTAVIGDPGFTIPSQYLFAGSGAGTRVSYAGSATGSGATISPTGAALTAHSHTVTGTAYYALFYIQRIT